MKSSLLKLIAINVGVTLGLLFGLNLLAHIVLLTGEQAMRLFNLDGGPDEVNEDRELAALPNYEGRSDEIFQHFRETFDIEMKYDPYLGWSREEFEGETITIDENGDRSHDALPNANTESPRVYIFGGSTVWGTGVVDNETLPAFYQGFAELQTINKGETAFISRQSFLSFSHLLAAGEEIDGVIFYEGVNDVQYGCRAELEVNEHARTQVFADRVEGGERDASPTRKFRSYWATLFFGAIGDLSAEVIDIINDNRESSAIAEDALICDTDPERAQQVAEALVANWELAHNLAEARGVEFMAVLQPVAYLGEPRIDHIHSVLTAEQGDQYRAVYPRIQALLAEHDYDWVEDYVPLLAADEEYYYIDFCHLSGNGNQKIAQRLYRDSRRRWSFL
ncbi:hypothetical protein [Vacuolonema iberomarrocanum]|uniref:hypothetical protein n=1 Tax=Vacuolonema iberomarrocanum TaxID=3454632 RepID=UPI0019DF3C45|nr:hypothetical protein [filamentous cyanobacterium LEGE 07170]